MASIGDSGSRVVEEERKGDRDNNNDNNNDGQDVDDAYDADPYSSAMMTNKKTTTTTKKKNNSGAANKKGAKPRGGKPQTELAATAFRKAEKKYKYYGETPNEENDFSDVFDFQVKETILSSSLIVSRLYLSCIVSSLVGSRRY